MLHSAGNISHYITVAPHRRCWFERFVQTLYLKLWKISSAGKVILDVGPNSSVSLILTVGYRFEDDSIWVKQSVMSWSHMTSHVMNLTRLEQFHIITYSEVDLFFIIHYLTKFINIPNHLFGIDLLNQLFEINLRNQSFHWISGATGLWYVTSLINVYT